MRSPGGDGHGDWPAGASVHTAGEPAYGAAPSRGPVLAGYDPEPEGMTLRDYLDVMWRRKWIIILVVVAATASAYFFSASQTKQYEAQATIIYKQQIDLSDPLSTSGTSTVNLDREIASIDSLLQGPTLQQRIGNILDGDLGVDPSVGYSVSAAADESSSTSSTSNNVVVFTGASSSAKLAAASANAAAKAYVAWNRQFQRKQISEAIPVIQRQLRQYQTEASKASTDYLLLKQRLQDLRILLATATGNYQTLAPATVPSTPVSPKPVRSAILGLGVGLFAGIGLAFLLEQFDTRVRQVDQVAAILRQPILGRVPRIGRKTLAEGALVAMRQPDGQVAEAFRMVRTNLDFMAVDAHVSSIVLTSCVQSEGKSVSVANLAVSMAMAGKKIIVVDADLRRPRQHTFFGLDNEKGVSTVAAQHHELYAALQCVNVEQPSSADTQVDFQGWAAGTDALSRLYVLTSGPIPPNPGEIVASRRFATIVEELTKEADLVLVDSPAMLAVGDTSAIAAKCDGLVFLVDLHQIKRPQLLTAADQLLRLPVRMLGTIVRMDGGHGGRYYSAYRYGYSYAEGGGKKQDRLRGESDRRSSHETPVA